MNHDFWRGNFVRLLLGVCALVLVQVAEAKSLAGGAADAERMWVASRSGSSAAAVRFGSDGVAIGTNATGVTFSAAGQVIMGAAAVPVVAGSSITWGNVGTAVLTGVATMGPAGWAALATMALLVGDTVFKKPDGSYGVAQPISQTSNNCNGSPDDTSLGSRTVAGCSAYPHPGCGLVSGIGSNGQAYCTVQWTDPTDHLTREYGGRWLPLSSTTVIGTAEVPLSTLGSDLNGGHAQTGFDSWTQSTLQKMLDDGWTPYGTTPTVTGPDSVPAGTSTTVNPDGSTSQQNCSYMLHYVGDVVTNDLRCDTTTTTPTTTTGVVTTTGGATTTGTVAGTPSVSTTSTTKSGATGSADAPPTDCDKYPDSAGCRPLGDPPTMETLPSKTVDIAFPAIVFQSNASCPTPVSFDVAILGQTNHVSMPWTVACDFLATYIKPVMLLIGALTGAFIFTGAFKV